MKRVAVIGGGIAGLAAAHELAKHPGCSPTLLEAGDRLGGTVETVSEGGFTIETGPDSWVSDRPALRELAGELGLGGEIIHSNDALRRTYLARGRTLTPLPDGMRMMVPTRWLPILESPLFSWGARLAFLREPKRAEELKAAALPEDQDETVRAFAERHFGREATDTVVGPLLAGVFGGNIDRLSAGAVLAPFVRMEREHGSLIAPVMALARREKTQPVFTTVRGGLRSVVDRLEASLPAGTIRRRSPVERLARAGEGWLVDGESFDAVVLATPVHETQRLLAELDAEAAALLPTEATSAIVVALCWTAPEAARIRVPRGFGFLVPPQAAPGAEPELLAATFMHQKFDHRAPPGGVFLRGFFGGEAAPRMMGWEDARIAEAARAHLARLLGPLPPARHVVVRRWPRSLPQYAVGHPQRMRALEERLQRLPGLRLTGNAYQGVGLPALVEHGQKAAAGLLAPNPA